ncbi:hypothetical protein QJS10_CPA01g00675 [Acorus calamus]|uniref:Uncharacterized protein n=1 Tax=Acorus calamus TaxID=4465 RepID=A0AAV9FG17_ACOCL|nr:hypothetical protein QJS10_CPA01g00675 [Acorus calamus]
MNNNASDSLGSIQSEPMPCNQKPFPILVSREYLQRREMKANSKDKLNNDHISIDMDPLIRQTQRESTTTSIFEDTRVYIENMFDIFEGPGTIHCWGTRGDVPRWKSTHLGVERDSLMAQPPRWIPLLRDYVGSSCASGWLCYFLFFLGPVWRSVGVVCVCHTRGKEAAVGES